MSPKTLLSIGFFAASGIYVAVANQLSGGPPGPDASIAATLLPPADTPLTSIAADPFSSQASSRLADPPLARTSTVAATAESAQASSSTRRPSPKVVAEASAIPAMPPLPRPRPNALTGSIRRSAAPASPAGAATGYRDGTYTGSDEDAYYGRVQVQLTIAAHQIVAVTVLDYPQDRRTSRYINSHALPLLKREVMTARGGRIDIVSGATLTSRAYIRSLRDALNQAGTGSA